MSYEIGTDGIDAIVVGFDGSERGRDALAFAAGMARRNSARLTVVYAPPATLTSLAAMSPLAGETLVVAQETIDAFVVDIRGVLRDYAVDAELILCRGDPAAVIEAVAEERRADAIVVGSTHLTGRRSNSSVPAKLLRSAQRPIMVIP